MRRGAITVVTATATRHMPTSRTATRVFTIAVNPPRAGNPPFNDASAACRWVNSVSVTSTPALNYRVDDRLTQQYLLYFYRTLYFHDVTGPRRSYSGNMDCFDRDKY